MKPLRPTRRDFQCWLGGLLAAPLAAGAARAQEPDAEQKILLANAEALTGMVRARFGKFLERDQLAELQKAILRKQLAADMLRKVKLKNDDEPSFAFRADV